jgi:hypothetical protein
MTRQAGLFHLYRGHKGQPGAEAKPNRGFVCPGTHDCSRPATAAKLFGTGAVTYVNKDAPTPTGTIKVTTKPVVLFYKDGTLTGNATSNLYKISYKGTYK